MSYHYTLKEYEEIVLENGHTTATMKAYDKKYNYIGRKKIIPCNTPPNLLITEEKLYSFHTEENGNIGRLALTFAELTKLETKSMLIRNRETIKKLFGRKGQTERYS